MYMQLKWTQSTLFEYEIYFGEIYFRARIHVLLQVTTYFSI